MTLGPDPSRGPIGDECEGDDEDPDVHSHLEDQKLPRRSAAIEYTIYGPSGPRMRTSNPRVAEAQARSGLRVTAEVL